ncbi:MAG: hypothetical protein V4636_13115 [Pseudomonadota bacterium]
MTRSALSGLSLADLRDLVGDCQGQTVAIAGHTAAGDGGGGTFDWDESEIGGDDNGMVIRPTLVGVGDPGRWMRLVTEGGTDSAWYGPTRAGLATCVANNRQVHLSRDYDFSSESLKIDVPSDTDIRSNGNRIFGPGFNITGDRVRISFVTFANDEVSGTTPLSGISGTNVEDIEIIDCRFDTSIVSIVNNQDEVRSGVAIRGCVFLGDFTAWTDAAGPNAIYVVGYHDVGITDNRMALTGVYRFLKLQASSFYLLATDEVGDAYCSRVVISGNMLSGSVSAAAKQVIDCYSGVGECVISNNTIMVTGASTIVEQKNDGATGPDSAKTRNLIIADNYLQGDGDRLVFLYGAYGLSYEDGPQLVSIHNNILRHDKDAAAVYAIECRGLHQVSIRGNSIDSINTDLNYYAIRVRNTQSVDVSGNQLAIGSITIDDGANTSTGDPYTLPTQSAIVTGNLLTDFSGLAGVYVNNLSGSQSLIIAANTLHSTSGTAPTQACVYIAATTVDRLLLIGNDGATGLVTYDRFLTSGTTIGLTQETANTWNAVNVRGTAENGSLAFGNAAGELTYNTDVQVVITGATKNLSVGGSLPGNVICDGPAGSDRGFHIRTGGVERWWIRGDSTTETGTGNSGTGLKIGAYDDAGNLLGTVAEVARAANGALTLYRPLAMANAIRHAIQTVTALSATLNMGLHDVARIAHASAQTVTTISIAGSGQRVTLIFTNSNTTIQSNATIKLAGGADVVGSADDVLSLVYDGTSGCWRETGRSMN